MSRIRISFHGRSNRLGKQSNAQNTQTYYCSIPIPQCGSRIHCGRAHHYRRIANSICSLFILRLSFIDFINFTFPSSDGLPVNIFNFLGLMVFVKSFYLDRLSWVIASNKPQYFPIFSIRNLPWSPT